MSTGTDPQTELLLIASMLWFASLVFSVGAALNSLLAMAWKATRSYVDCTTPYTPLEAHGLQRFARWKITFLGDNVDRWITADFPWNIYRNIFGRLSRLRLFLRPGSDLPFAHYHDRSNQLDAPQAIYTPYVTVVATGVTFIGLVAILIWMIYEICVSPVLKQQANVILKSSGESVHSDVSKLSLFSSGIVGTLSNALSSLGLPKHRGADEEDVEKIEEISTVTEESPAEKNVPRRLKAKLQDSVKNVSMLNTAMAAFTLAGHQHRRNLSKPPPSLRNRLHIDTNVPSVPPTQLNLPTEPATTIELARYGTIHDIAYSEDGKWLAVTWLVTS